MELVLLAPGILRDHDEFRAMVHASDLPVRLIEVDNYDFKTRSLCYNRKLAFLGMTPLAHQYTPLTSIPAAWEVPVHIGLISRFPAWDDLALLVSKLTTRLQRLPDKQ